MWKALNVSLVLPLSCFPLNNFQYRSGTDRHFSEFSKRRKEVYWVISLEFMKNYKWLQFYDGQIEDYLWPMCLNVKTSNTACPASNPSPFQHVQDECRQNNKWNYVNSWILWLSLEEKKMLTSDLKIKSWATLNISDSKAHRWESWEIQTHSLKIILGRWNNRKVI